MNVKITSAEKNRVSVFWYMTPCSLVDVYRRFGTEVLPQFSWYSSALKMRRVEQYVTPKRA
jgi:hypothetical protein